MINQIARCCARPYRQIERVIIDSLNKLTDDSWRNSEGRSDYLNFIPKKDLVLSGYGRSKFFQEDKISPEISIFNEQEKTFIHKETFEGNDLNRVENTFDHLFTLPINLKKGIKYTIIEKNMIDNRSCYSSNIRSESTRDFDFSNDSIPSNITNNCSTVNSGKFVYFLVNYLDD